MVTREVTLRHWRAAIEQLAAELCSQSRSNTPAAMAEVKHPLERDLAVDPGNSTEQAAELAVSRASIAAVSTLVDTRTATYQRIR